MPAIHTGHSSRQLAGHYLSEAKMTVPTQYGFIEPPDFLDAENRRILLIEQIQDIEMQLGESGKLDQETGQLLQKGAYDSWRRKARFALKIKKAEYNYIGRWIKRRKESWRSKAIMIAIADPSKADGLLMAAYRIFKRSFSGGISPFIVHGDDQSVIDGMRDYLEGRDCTPITHLREVLNKAMPLILECWDGIELPDVISELRKFSCEAENDSGNVA